MARRRELLGMDPGTAATRLRLMILFHVLERHDENVCYRCGGIIATYKELSIEHIEPWEGRSAELFWDLENIAFSHRPCNQRHVVANGSRSKRIVAPEGQAWCSTCKAFKPVEEFYSGTRWNGLSTQCKGCHHDRKVMLRQQRSSGEEDR